MTILQRVTVRMPYLNGLPTDVSENTFSFSVTDSETTVADAAINARLQAFYNAVTAGVSIASRIAPIVNRNTVQIVHRAVDPATGDQVGGPRFYPMTPFAGAASNASVPLEVALVTSFRAGNASGPVPIARRTGRIFLGPLGTDTLGGGADPVPSLNFIQRCNASAEALWASNGPSPIEMNWCVWSRTDGELYAVTNGWTDNEWDTQRRRGNRATNRQLWPL